MMRLSAYLSCLGVACLLAACELPTKPIDADTRQAIDSIAGSQTVMAQMQMDSLCNLDRQTKLPLLVDSIKQHRMAEIEAQLRGVPK